MANICSNSIIIYGKKAQLEALVKLIENQDKDLIEIFPYIDESRYADYTIWEDTLTESDDRLSFSFGSKWSPPLDSIKVFCDHLNAILMTSAEGSWEETGCDIYGNWHYEDGNFNYQKIEGVDYYADNQPDFAE